MEEVPGGVRVYFSTLMELCDHLRRRTGMAVPRRRWKRRPFARAHHARGEGGGDVPSA